jgi:hypothetical protein
MRDEELNQAAAYLKLHEDVRHLILTTVVEELRMNPYGMLAAEVGRIASNYSKGVIDREIQNYRIVYKGNTASY